MIRRIKPYLIVFFLVVLSRCQWGSQNNISNSQKVFNRKDTIFVSAPEFQANLDWQKIVDPGDSFLAYNIMDGLTEIDFSARPMKAKPQLASSWEVDKTGRYFTFTLAENVTWTDGQPLVAKHFVDAFSRLAKNNNPQAMRIFGQIKNFKEFSSGEIKDFKQVGVSAPAENKVSFELSEENISFPILLSHPMSFPVRMDLISKSEAEAFHPAKIVTLGAYQIKKVEKEKLLLLTANSKHLFSKPKITNVVVYFGLNANNLKSSVKQKIVDIILEPQQTFVDYFKDNKDLVFLPNWGIVYLTFHFKGKPFENLSQRY